ncbi:hypothetical protein Tco_1442908, partial [Tanacetum coccineum]
ALKLLTFREQRVVVQFWSPRVVGQHQLLTTIDQPFGLGVHHDESLLSYRRASQHNLYVVDKDYDEVDLSPPARVFMLGLSEWSSDLTNYLSKHFPQQECAIRCNLHGYLVLPVFDSTTRLCVGTLELLASSKYTSFDYEVQQFETALKTQKLTCLQVLDDPASNSPMPSMAQPRKSKPGPRLATVAGAKVLTEMRLIAKMKMVGFFKRLVVLFKRLVLLFKGNGGDR